MGLIAKDNGGGDFLRVPAGVHVGRCFRIVDLGTQETEWQGETRLRDQVSIYWELHGEFEDGRPLKDEKGEPLTIRATYTNSLGKKAKLRADLESWRGRPFTDEELKGFELPKLLGAYCLVNVVEADRGGKTYSNVQSLTPIPRGMPKPPPVLPNLVFSLDEFDEDVFQTFHEKLREKINASMQRRGGSAPQQTESQKRGMAAFADMDDDIPF